MKNTVTIKNIAIFCIIILVVCCMASCEDKGIHFLEEHSYEVIITEPTCTERGYATFTCSCGEYYVTDYTDPKGHSFGEWVTVKMPTITEEGSEEKTCACGEKIYQSIKMLVPSEGLEFTLNRKGDSYSVSGMGTCTDMDLVIPDSYNGLPVTYIEEHTFSSNTSITSVYIPDSVKNIGNSAFRQCTSLISITIHADTYTMYGVFDDCTSLENVYFMGDVKDWICKQYHSNPMKYATKLYLNGELLTDVVIPDSERIIPASAFLNCATLESVTIPESVSIIGGEAFAGCTSLKNIYIPNSVVSIDTNAFEGCTSLTSITIPDSVKTIYEFAFAYCTALESITIPESVVSIGNSAFRNCTSLKSIMLPNSVVEIGGAAFYNCSSLSEIRLPKYLTTIKWDLFHGCTSLESIIVPSYVNSIGSQAFEGCISLENITIGRSVTKIDGNAFLGCKSLYTIEYGGTVGEWEDVVKELNWALAVPATEITCSNGNTPLVNKEY